VFFHVLQIVLVLLLAVAIYDAVAIQLNHVRKIAHLFMVASGTGPLSIIVAFDHHKLRRRWCILVLVQVRAHSET
jgi:hypothetical protein